MLNFGNVYTGDSKTYYINAIQTIYQSGVPVTRSTDLGNQVGAYILLNPDKAFTEWNDTDYEKKKIIKEINTLQAYLDTTDRHAMKCAELGLDMATEYPEEHATRAEYRTKIDKLREQLKQYE